MKAPLPAEGTVRATCRATPRTIRDDRPRAATAPRGPDPARLAAVVALAWLEVLNGQRPRRQLDGVLSPALRRRLASQVTVGGHPDGPVRLRRVVSCEPRPGAMEAAVLIEHSGRTSALAVRLERHLGAWRAVELTAPETGLRPLATASLVRRSAPDAFDEELLEPCPSEPASPLDHQPGADAPGGQGSTAAHSPDPALESPDDDPDREATPQLRLRDSA